MLAVQRPSMGSSKPPDLDMPFGYSFDTPSNYPFPSPTAPAPGPSLLDDNDSKFLENFFEGVSSDHFNYDFFTNQQDGSELGVGWDELPPTFMGTTSSFGPQPQTGSHDASDMSFHDINSHMSSAGPSIPTSTSEDILAAASVLQNGSNSRSRSMGNEALFRGQDMSIAPSNGGVRPHSISQYRAGQSNPAERPSSDDNMRDHFYTDMVFGSQFRESIRPRQMSETHSKADIRWGSDSGFGIPEGFVPSISQRKEVAALELSHIKAVEGAFIETQYAGRISSSADTTRPSSPVRPRISISHQKTKSTGRINDEDDQNFTPKKRRRSKFQEDDEDEESPLSAIVKQGSKKRKSIRNNSSSGPEQNNARRKSAATAAANAAAKATRENLTEDQKRENHIKSEQKRRTLIREGFEDLGELVPGLRGGGFSKSAVLIMSADWLEELVQGNEVLRQRLEQMQGR